MWRALRVLLGVIGVGLLAVVVTLAVLTRTNWGARVALEVGLGQLEGRFDGSLRVDEIETTNLLQNVTLRGVRVEDARGTPLIVIDSLRISYRAGDLVRQRVHVRSGDVWGARLFVLQGSDGRTNVERVFAPDGSPESRDRSAGSAWAVRLWSTRIHDADVEVRTRQATEPDSATGVFEPTDDGRWWRVLRVTELDAEVGEATLTAPGQEGEIARIDALRATVRVFPDPVRIEVLRGRVARAGSAASLEDAAFTVGTSSFEGNVRVDWSEGLAYDLRLSSDGFDPGDFAIVEPRLPRGHGQGRLRAAGRDGRGTFAFENAELRVAGSRLEGSLEVTVADSVAIAARDLVLDPLELSLLAPWAPELPDSDLVLRGRVSGEGGLERLNLSGRIEVDASDGSLSRSALELDGGIGLGDGPRAYGLRFEADPLDFALLERVSLDVPLTGPGAIRGSADGSFARALTLDITATHRPTPEDTSRVRFDGNVAGAGDAIAIDGRVDLLGFHLTSLAQVDSGLAVPETVWGTLDLDGHTADLTVAAQLQSTVGDVLGSVRVAQGGEADLDLLLYGLDPAAVVRSEARLDLNGRLTATLTKPGDGPVQGRATLELDDSDVARTRVDTAFLSLRFADGSAAVDTAFVGGSGWSARGSGTVGLDTLVAPGRLDLALESTDLGTLLGHGTGPDTAAAESAERSDDTSVAEASASSGTEGGQDDEPRLVSGTARGTLRVRSAFPRIEAEGEIDLLALTYAGLHADSARLRFDGTDVIADGRVVRVEADVANPRIFDRAFAIGEARALLQGDSVAFELAVAHSDGAGHTAAGAVVLADSRTELRVDRATLDVAGGTTHLDAPARISWGEQGVDIDEVRVVSARSGATKLVVRGRVPREGVVDVRASAHQLDLSRITAIWLREPLHGTADGELAFHGPSTDPSLEGSLRIRGLALRESSLPSFDASLAYADEVARVKLDAREDGSAVLDARIEVPVDLAPASQDPRLPDRPLSGHVAVRDFPLGIVVSSPSVIDDVGGHVTGELSLSGTALRPLASGSLDVVDGELSLPELGVRYGVDGHLDLNQDGNVDVDLLVTSGGAGVVSGTVGLHDLGDPTFDLTARADTFRVMERRDVSGSVSGEARFGGSWSEPRLEGSIQVGHGEVRLDELARSRQVADLSEADFYTVVDTTIFSQEIPPTPSFVDRSSLSLDLAFRGGTWIRSRELDAELAGDVTVTHEPGQGYGLTGELRTVRGSYRGFGRTFQVTEGTVLFPGAGSVDPVLDIATVTRIRSSDQALDIVASLQGTATEPEVTLSSPSDPPMAQEELISYLVFGRPSYALGSGENAVVSGVTGAASSMALGLVANELGSALGREIGMFDYFAISAPQEVAEYGQSEAARSSIASTQVEFGHYLSENLFLAAVFRPLDSANQFAGGRLEWRFRDGTSWEVFLEDRLARSPSATFGDLGFTLEQSLGTFLAREWSY